jgi:beta-galactosidase/beta-glucuronidase
MLLDQFTREAFINSRITLTPFIKPGDNVLEADVSKMSADSSVNRAEREGDFWVFGGIYRPVYLKIQPENFIKRVAIDAKADGKFNMDVWIENIRPRDVITAQIKTLKGDNIGDSPFSTIANNIELVHLSHPFPGIQAWNPEFPKLYKVEISIVRKNKIIHTTQQRFGFRTMWR